MSLPFDASYPYCSGDCDRCNISPRQYDELREDKNIYIVIDGETVARFSATVIKRHPMENNMGFLKDGRKVIRKNNRWIYTPPK